MYEYWADQPLYDLYVKCLELDPKKTYKEFMKFTALKDHTIKNHKDMLIKLIKKAEGGKENEGQESKV